MNISVVIITKDEAENIERCISALSTLTDDIIVVDSGSADGTQQIATQMGARVYPHSWDGYGANKNFGASQTKYDWILSVDADEVLDNDLIAFIQELELDPKCLYYVNVLTSYCGKWIKHCGWHPLWRARLFYKYDHQWNENLIHEELTSLPDKKKVRLAGNILHYSYPNREKYESKVDHYAKLKAEGWVKNKKRPSWLKKQFGPIFRFVRTYFLKLGFLDGKAGWEISVMNKHMIEKSLKYYDALR